MSYDVEHGGLHELFFLDGIAAAADKALQLLEEAIVSQQGVLQDSVSDMRSDASDYDYAVDDIRVLNQAIDDVKSASSRVKLVRETIGGRIS